MGEKEKMMRREFGRMNESYRPRHKYYEQGNWGKRKHSGIYL